MRARASTRGSAEPSGTATARPPAQRTASGGASRLRNSLISGSPVAFQIRTTPATSPVTAVRPSRLVATVRSSAEWPASLASRRAVSVSQTRAPPSPPMLTNRSPVGDECGRLRKVEVPKHHIRQLAAGQLADADCTIGAQCQHLTAAGGDCHAKNCGSLRGPHRDQGRAIEVEDANRGSRRHNQPIALHCKGGRPARQSERCAPPSVQPVDDQAAVSARNRQDLPVEGESNGRRCARCREALLSRTRPDARAPAERSCQEPARP